MMNPSPTHQTEPRWRLLRVDQNDRKRDKHKRLTDAGALRMHTFLSTYIEVQPTARTEALAVKMPENVGEGMG